MKKSLSSFLFALALFACSNLPSDSFAQNSTTNINGVSIITNRSTLSDPTKVITKRSPLTAFSSLKASTGVEVIFKQGPKSAASMKVTVTREYANYLTASVKNGVMTVGWDIERLRSELKHKKFELAARVEITAPTPSKVEMSSGSTLQFVGTISHPSSLEFKANSGSDIKANAISCGTFRANTSSGASFHAQSAHADRIGIDASSGSSVTLTDVVAINGLKVDISSGSSGKLSLNDNPSPVITTVSSGATLELSGIADGEISMNASSAGNIDASSLKAASARAEASSGASIHSAKVKKLRFKESSCGNVEWSGTPEVTKL